jgi:hypothetical protein
LAVVVGSLDSHALRAAPTWALSGLRPCRKRAVLAAAMTWLAWYAPGIYNAVMDYMDHVDGDPRPQH